MIVVLCPRHSLQCLGGRGCFPGLGSVILRAVSMCPQLVMSRSASVRNVTDEVFPGILVGGK